MDQVTVTFLKWHMTSLMSKISQKLSVIFFFFLRKQLHFLGSTVSWLTLNLLDPSFYFLFVFSIPSNPSLRSCFSNLWFLSLCECQGSPYSCSKHIVGIAFTGKPGLATISASASERLAFSSAFPGVYCCTYHAVLEFLFKHFFLSCWFAFTGRAGAVCYAGSYL